MDDRTTGTISGDLEKFKKPNPSLKGILADWARSALIIVPTMTGLAFVARAVYHQIFPGG